MLLRGVPGSSTWATESPFVIVLFFFGSSSVAAAFTVPLSLPFTKAAGCSCFGIAATPVGADEESLSILAGEIKPDGLATSLLFLLESVLLLFFVGFVVVSFGGFNLASDDIDADFSVVDGGSNSPVGLGISTG